MTPLRSRLRIVVSGMIAADSHQGGAAWAVLQYVLGLRSLGHDVFLIEPIAPKALRPAGATLVDSINARYFRDVTTRFDLTARAALVRQDTRESAGLAYSALVEAATDSDLLINISGMLIDPSLLEHIPRRVYLDLDPAFNQLWHAVQGIDIRLAGHTHFVTVGSLIGTPACNIPTCGRSWLPTWQPIVLAEWPATPPRPKAAWTTVGNWRGYGSIAYDGVMYGQKVHSFRRFMDLPRRTGELLRPALSIHPNEIADLDALHANGWELVDPAAVAGTPDGYRRFIQDSKGELGIAKSGYVESRCGWFSDRSVCYLASGRPVVAQDTGFARRLPTGDGLFAFNTIEEAAAALDTASLDYDRHCRRARQIADAYFRSDFVLSTLLERVGATDDTRSQPASMDVDAAVGRAAPSGGTPR
jgi:hypothetical protein